MALSLAGLQAATPVAWFKADALTNLSNGASVGTWSDSSGHGYDATQSTTAQQPVYVTDGLNGRPVVRFSAASSTSLRFSRPVQDDFTMVGVFRSSQGLGAGPLFYQGAGLVNGEVGGVVNDFGTCLFANGQVCAGTGNPDTAVLSGTGFNDGLAHVFSFTRVRSAGEMALYVDGALAGLTLGSTASLTSPGQLALGAQQPGGNYLSGDLAEVQIYANALSTADRAGLERSLAAKYAILPAAPVGLVVQVVQGQPALNWPGSSFASAYHIKRATSSTGPFVLVGSTPACTFTDSSAVPGAAYCYTVAGVDATGREGPASPPVSVASPRYSLYSGPACLTLRSNAGKYDLVVQLTNGAALYQQPSPMAVNVVKSGGAQAWYTAPYTAVQLLANGALRCLGSLTSANGSTFSFTDTYQVLDQVGTFGVDRSVKVLSAAGTDSGFSTKLVLQAVGAGSLDSLDLFLPTVWCGAGNAPPFGALGYDRSDFYCWVREDRLPLPAIMLRQTNNGATFWLAHRHPDGSTFSGEDFTPLIVDGRMQFGAVGVENPEQPAAGLVFPGSEGERTLIGGNGSTKRWALRAHPVRANFAQTYSLAFRLTTEFNYVAALTNTWAGVYALFAPAQYACDLNLVYQAGINVLNRYWSSINGVAGVPFRIPLNGTVSDTNDYNFQMGFTGMEPCNGAVLVHEGLGTTNSTLRIRGEQMLDFWASRSLTATGIARTWYNPIPQSWRSDATWIRTATDGMLGLLWGWKYERQHGSNQAAWLNACVRFGNWIVSQQAADGSVPRVWSYQSGAVTDAGKYNTSHIVRYLVELYLATGTDSYRAAALSAGNYIYQDVHVKFSYLGGADTGPDKEAASMALRAFSALYDLTGDSRWLAAAQQAARYYATWIYSWQVPIPADDAAAVYPAARPTAGLSLISMGGIGCDSYAATDAFEVYRLYLASGAPDLLQLAGLMLYNTKQGLNWDPNDPMPGFGDPGIMNEALQLVPPRGHGVGWYLPWQTANYLEPMIHLQDTFGSYRLELIEGMDWPVRQAKNHAFALTRGYPCAQAVPASPAGLQAAGQAGQIQVTWNLSPGARYYNLKRASAVTGPYSLVASQSGTNFIDLQVSAERAYFYVVSALGPGGESTDSAPVQAMAHAMPALSAGLGGGNQIRLAWPDWAANLALFYSTNLSSPQAWLPVSDSPCITNGTAVLALPATPDGQRFFRLAPP
jgi:hypothetical protein